MKDIGLFADEGVERKENGEEVEGKGREGREGGSEYWTKAIE